MREASLAGRQQRAHPGDRMNEIRWIAEGDVERQGELLILRADPPTYRRVTSR